VAFGVGGWFGAPGTQSAHQAATAGRAARLGFGAGRLARLAAPVVLLHRAKGTARAVPCSPYPRRIGVHHPLVRQGF
jgi:hypothetical protein